MIEENKQDMPPPEGQVALELSRFGRHDKDMEKGAIRPGHFESLSLGARPAE